MELKKIEIPKSQLLSISKEERVFFIQSLNLLNELIILRKLVIFSSNHTNKQAEIVQKAQSSQTLFLLKIQAGKLYEGYKLLSKHFTHRKLSKTYQVKLSASAKNSLKALNKYFNKQGGNLISLIRNEFAFHDHLTSDKIENLITNAPTSQVFYIFTAKNHGNYYDIANVLINLAMLKSVNGSNEKESLRKILEDIKKITHWFLDFLENYVQVIIKENFNLNYIKIEMPNPPNIKEITLPYFITF